MKKILFVLVLGFSAAAAQASTCETRVDSHQGATTVQRVKYCLNEPKPEEVIIKSIPKNEGGFAFLYPFLIGMVFALAGTPCSTPI